MNVGRYDLVFEAGGDEEIVDAPTDVVGAGAAEIAPPGVVAVALMEEAQSVDETSVEEGLESGSFFEGIAFFAFVWFGAGEVVRGVGYIEVAAEDDGLGFVAKGTGFEAFAIFEERGVPVVAAQGDTRKVVFGIGCVDGDHIEVFELGSEDAAFSVGIAIFVAAKSVFGFYGVG